MKYNIIVYIDKKGKEPYTIWFFSLRDDEAKVKIQKRILRIIAGNLGDFKALGSGIYELRLDFGPGYRIYYGASSQCIILLCGGDKKSQNWDIEKAKLYWKDYKENPNEKL